MRCHVLTTYRGCSSPASAEMRVRETTWIPVCEYHAHPLGKHVELRRLEKGKTAEMAGEKSPSSEGDPS